MDRGDDILENLEQMVHNSEGNDKYNDKEFAKFLEFMWQFKEPLYPGCEEQYMLLHVVLLLLKLKASKWSSDKCFIALLHLL